MKRAVKNLIKDRGLSKYKHQNVQVEHWPCRPFRYCMSNATNEAEWHRQGGEESPSPVKRVSGWLVGEFNRGYAGLTPHFWNYDTRTNTFYDTTERGYFNNSNHEEYVIDPAVDSLETPKDQYCRIVYKKDNQAYLIGKKVNVPLESFTNEEIYLLQKKHGIGNIVEVA